MKKVLITGANGFIAQYTAGVLKEEGCFIIGTSRKAAPVSHFDEIFHGTLGKPLEGVFEKHSPDAMIHCAFDKGDTDNMRNAKGTSMWAEQAEKSEVALQIFVSSLSADENALAPYGRKKYEVEQWFLQHNQIVFRPGLVIGKGGLFGRIVETVKKSPVIPLIDNGRTLTYVTGVDTLTTVIADTVFNRNNVTRARVWNLQQASPVYFGDILKEISAYYRLSRLFIPIPSIVISLILYLADKFDFFKHGITVNNIKGMRQHGQKEYTSDLHFLGYAETPIEEMVRKLAV